VSLARKHLDFRNDVDQIPVSSLPEGATQDPQGTVNSADLQPTLLYSTVCCKIGSILARDISQLETREWTIRFDCAHAHAIKI
jgi:hypothetical protein